MSIESDWTLDTARVDVWSLALDDEGDASLVRFLDAGEQERAARMRAGEVRNSFIKARAALRCLLARYLDILPLEVPITLNRYGKPMLGDGTKHPSLRFNLTHSRGLAMYAVTSEREIGIDVEWMDAAVNWKAVAPTVFSAAEVVALVSTPEPEQRPAFFTAWTRKEAFLKGLGTGFGTPETPPCIDAWTLVDLSTGPEYKAAIAVHGNAAFGRVQRRLDAALLFSSRPS